MRMKVEELRPYTPSWEHEIVGSVVVVRLLAGCAFQAGGINREPKARLPSVRLRLIFMGDFHIFPRSLALLIVGGCIARSLARSGRPPQLLLFPRAQCGLIDRHGKY